MASQNQIDLNALTMRPGDGRRIEFSLDAEPMSIGGQPFAVKNPVSGLLGISRTNDGYALHLDLSASVSGPCQRCLEGSVQELEIDAREVDHASASDPELRSPYVDDEILDLAAWTRDAIRLQMPEKPLCRPDCAGLCPECGESLNDADPADHEHGQTLDPRFAKLRELDLGGD